MPIGFNVRNLRNKMNLTQCELAERINKDVSTISKIETNSAKPSIDTLTALAQALGVSISELLEEKKGA